MIRSTMTPRHFHAAFAILLVAAVAVTGCGRDQPPVARPTPPPASGADAAGRTPSPPSPVAEPRSVPPEPLSDDQIASASLDELNKNSPLRPVFFAYDSSELTPEALATLNETAEFLQRYSTWTVTIEGHTDERGTAEYNLALGERRAMTAQAYLGSLGIPASRLRTVSYGKEFPFEPGHEEGAWSRNRRAHFVITSR